MHFLWTLSHQSIHIYTDYSSIIYNDMLCLFKCWSTCAYWLFYFENLYNNWKLIAFSLPIHFLKSFEDTKLVIGSRKSKKDWQHNGLKKKDNSTNNYLPNTTLKIGQHKKRKWIRARRKVSSSCSTSESLLSHVMTEIRVLNNA